MTNKPIMIALLVSVTLNLLVAGAVIGHFLRGAPEPRFPGHLGRVMEKIDPEQQAVMKEQFRAFRREGRQLHQDMRQKQRELTKSILAEPFDEESARQGFAQLRQSGAAIQTQMHEQMISVMKNLGPKQRARLIRRLQQEGKEGRNRREQDRQLTPP
jgi:Spy/CpxP family protein refolding chaperone